MTPKPIHTQAHNQPQDQVVRVRSATKPTIAGIATQSPVITANRTQREETPGNRRKNAIKSQIPSENI